MEAYSRSWAEWRLAWIFSRPSWAVGCRRPARRRRFPCTVRRCHGSVQSRVAITILALVNLVSLTCLQNGPNSGITNWFLKAFDRSPMFSRTTLWISKVCIWVWNFPVDSQLLISKINTYHNWSSYHLLNCLRSSSRLSSGVSPNASFFMSFRLFTIFSSRGSDLRIPVCWSACQNLRESLTYVSNFKFSVRIQTIFCQLTST